MQYVLIVLGVVIIILLAVVIKKLSGNNVQEELKDEIYSANKDLRENLVQTINESTRTQSQMSSEAQRLQMDMLTRMQATQQQSNRDNADFIAKQIEKMTGFQSTQSRELFEFQREQFETIMESNSQQQEKVARTLDTKLDSLQKSNESKMESMESKIDKRLEEIRGTVSEKLDKTLNDRLDSSFKQIGDQLGELYRSLGELNQLSSGVSDLNRTLSNVKTRGTWGEIQLQGILEQTMVASQYDTNVPTKKNSNDRVEFAIKIPSKDDDTFIYLPIDSKMPSDIYAKIVDAAQFSDQQALAAACKELEQRIKTEARTIRDKYIDPPRTTDFAIMFLPTEGLYSEALRINGLAEWCQVNCSVVIAGPTTITALLNSLRLGFSNLALTKKSQDVLKLLQAIKSQYTQFSEMIDKTQKKLHDAMSSTDALKSRADIIQRKMSKVEQLELPEANALLGIEEEM